MFPFLNQNPQSIAIKKYLFEILKEKYPRNEKFIDRLASQTITKEDYENLGSFITDVFETGFLKAINEYKDQIEKMGLKVNVVPEEKPKNANSKIFNN